MDDGSEVTRQVEPHQAHGPIVLTHFDKAEVLGEKSERPKSKVIFPPEYSASAKQLGGQSIGLRARENVPRFAQLLAKIGLGVAVSEFGVKGFHPLVRDFIRFLPNDYRHWVGGLNDEDTPSDALHEIGLQIKSTDYGVFIIAGIRLFASFGAPTNYVVVGKPLGREKFQGAQSPEIARE